MGRVRSVTIPSKGEPTMEASKPKRNQNRSLNQIVNRGLVSYATAATGAGVLGLAQLAEAAALAARCVGKPLLMRCGPRLCGGFPRQALPTPVGDPKCAQ